MMDSPRTIVPPKGFAHAFAPLGGAPVPSLTNHGGPVLGSVEVACLYWGGFWSQAAGSDLAGKVDAFFDFILTSQYLDMLAEYGTSGTPIGHGRHTASMTISNNEPGSDKPTGREVTDAEIQTEVASLIASGSLPATNANSLYFVMLPPNVTSIMSDGNKSCAEFCGYHNAFGNVYYAVIPYTSCNGCVFDGDIIDTLTEVISHELAEAITDPALNAWWDAVSGNEIGDICNRQTVRLGGYLVQTEWSNNQGACVIAPPAAWRQFELAAAGTVSLDRGGIAAVSRIPGSMELFSVGSDGSVQDAYWYDNATWQRFALAPPGSASSGGGIAAVSRIPGSMEVWWVAPNGSIQDAYWYEGAGWKQFELAPPGSAATSTRICAVSRIPNSMELWWIAPDGSVQGAYWYEGANWGRYQLAPPGSASLTTGVTAVSRIPTSMEVWWIGPNGSVQDAYWYENGGWNRFELASAGSASPGSGIAAVSRIPGSMELWWGGADGTLRDAYWYDNSGWHQFDLTAQGRTGGAASVAAVSRISGSMEVWWTGPNGELEDAYWYG